MKVKFANRIYEVLFTKELAGLTMYAVEDEPNHIDWLINVEVIDAENKELKKIHVIDEGKSEMDYCFTKMMNGEKVSSAWSEEDISKLNKIATTIYEAGEVQNWWRQSRLIDKETANELNDWLKSLKYRVKPQNLTVTDEELAQAKKDAYNDALDKIEYHSGKPTFEDGWSAAIWYLKKRDILKSQSAWSEEDEEMLYSILNVINGGWTSIPTSKYTNWLKSFKDRVQPQWKPSEEQMQALAEALSLANNCGEDSAFDLRTLHEQLNKLK